ncbi:hypothetical protein F5Y08DRAFT_337470 [Xylaria arbuscula]|nr:hypothetical protein F5Y08DRAFT_337470 [Xylaria arbuscula]
MDSELGRELNGGKKKAGRPRKGGGPGVRRGRPRKKDGGRYQALGLRAPKTKFTAPPTTVKTRLATGALTPMNYCQYSGRNAALPPRPRGRPRVHRRRTVIYEDDQGEDDEEHGEEVEEDVIEESANDDSFADSHYLFGDDGDRFASTAKSASLGIEPDDRGLPQLAAISPCSNCNDPVLVPESSNIEQTRMLPGLDGPSGGVAEDRQNCPSQRPGEWLSTMPSEKSILRRARDDMSDFMLFEDLTGSRKHIRSKSQEIPESPRKRRLSSVSPPTRPAKRRATIFNIDYNNSDEASESSDESQDRNNEEEACEDYNQKSQKPSTLDSNDELGAGLRRLTEAIEKLTLLDVHHENLGPSPRWVSPIPHRGFCDREHAPWRYYDREAKGPRRRIVRYLPRSRLVVLKVQGKKSTDLQVDFIKSSMTMDHREGYREKIYDEDRGLSAREEMR